MNDKNTVYVVTQTAKEHRDGQERQRRKVIGQAITGLFLSTIACASVYMLFWQQVHH